MVSKNVRMAVYIVVGVVGGVSVALGLIDSDQFSGWLATIPGVMSVIGGVVAGTHITNDPKPDTTAIDSLDTIRNSLGGL